VLDGNQYDVYHSHGDEFLGDGVKVAAMAAVPVRIAHCHGTVLARGKGGVEMHIRSWRQKTLERARILRHATNILACSNDAGRYLVGRYWDEDPRCRPLYCGVPLEQFTIALNMWSRDKYRVAHGIRPDAFVVGHVGSMGPSPVKNHHFMLEVLRELVRRDERFYLYLAGDGPDRPALQRKIEEMRLDSRVIMPGLCEDVPSLMVHGFDVLLLPSLWEGLPVVGLEAVASGLFTICSDSITRDFTGYFPGRIARLSLSEKVSHWADEVADGVEKRVDTQVGIELLKGSPFSIHNSLRNLLDIYQQHL
jgi:glycosyltransferase EpsF